MQAQRNGCAMVERMSRLEVWRAKPRGGTYSLAFFLQVLVALDAESPAQWTKAIDRCIDSEECATHVFLLELKRHSVDPARLAKHLAKVSADITPDALTALIETGSFPLP